jgi:hypothetical protein
MSEKIDIISEYSPDFRRINVTNVYGHIEPNGIEASVYSEQVLIDGVISEVPINKKKSKIKRTIECELIIDPMQIVSLHEWLGKKISEYEHVFGKIPTQKEMLERANTLKPDE